MPDKKYANIAEAWAFETLDSIFELCSLGGVRISSFGGVWGRLEDLINMELSLVSLFITASLSKDEDIVEDVICCV